MLKVTCPDGVYQPREDTDLIVSSIDEKMCKEKDVLDMGTGSGILAIYAAKYGAYVTAADIDEKSIKAAKNNFEKNNVSVKIIKSDLFSNIQGKYDLILFNSPYLPENATDVQSRQWAGGLKMETIRRFLIDAKKFLKGDGKILLLVSSVSDIETTDEFKKYESRLIASKKIFFEELKVYELLDNY